LDVGRVSPDEAADREALLVTSGERDLWLRRLLAAELAAWRAGYAAGRADERRAGDRAWSARAPLKVSDGPDLAELEALRWELRGEPRTRETFGLPHPDDYMGGPVNSDRRRAA
jgi:hypothetical protein